MATFSPVALDLPFLTLAKLPLEHKKRACTCYSHRYRTSNLIPFKSETSPLPQDRADSTFSKRAKLADLLANDALDLVVSFDIRRVNAGLCLHHYLFVFVLEPNTV